MNEFLIVKTQINPFPNFFTSAAFDLCTCCHDFLVFLSNIFLKTVQNDILAMSSLIYSILQKNVAGQALPSNKIFQKWFLWLMRHEYTNREHSYFSKQPWCTHELSMCTHSSLCILQLINQCEGGSVALYNVTPNFELLI